MRGVIEEQIGAIGQLNLLISEYDLNRDIELAQSQLERSPEKKKTAVRSAPTQARGKPAKIGFCGNLITKGKDDREKN